MLEIKEPIIKNIEDAEYKALENIEYLENYNFTNSSIKLEDCIKVNSTRFDKIIFDKSIIKNSNLDDVIFINCDLSNLTFMNTLFYRVKFINCKLFGTNFIDSSFNDVQIIDSNCTYINIAGSKINSMLITSSNFSESTLIDSKIKTIILDNVNFKMSEIQNTSLNNIDISKSNIGGLKTDLYSLKGAVIDINQSMDLIGLLGVKIK